MINLSNWINTPNRRQNSEDAVEINHRILWPQNIYDIIHGHPGKFLSTVCFVLCCVITDFDLNGGLLTI